MDKIKLIDLENIRQELMVYRNLAISTAGKSISYKCLLAQEEVTQLEKETEACDLMEDEKVPDMEELELKNKNVYEILKRWCHLPAHRQDLLIRFKDGEAWIFFHTKSDAQGQREGGRQPLQKSLQRS
ncbi:hypothetical protein L6452_13549 [Arctium lappa]|uniref:Uncharacterized protein n=1 Tax=Arctium lappa TaxID=4217 RepID=A0ACB9CIV1_ARCLA|nr:hypothetical protein L6452_13549 [Arctium lappa]